MNPILHASNLGSAGIADETPGHLLSRAVYVIRAAGGHVDGIFVDDWRGGKGYTGLCSTRKWTIDVCATEGGDVVGAVCIDEMKGQKEVRVSGVNTLRAFHSVGVHFAGPLEDSSANSAVRALLGVPDGCRDSCERKAWLKGEDWASILLAA